MTNFSIDDYEILFKKDWHTTRLDEDIAKIDRKALRDEYKQLVENALHRSDKQKYFVCHDGKLPSSKKSNRREEHLAVALWNLKGRWPCPDGGWFRLLDYQVPLQAQRSDQGIGKVDLLGLTDQGQLMVIELKVKPDGDNKRGEPPVKALIQGLRYAAIVEANRKQIAEEAERCFGVDVVAERPLVQVIAPKAWWEGWLNMAGSTREAAGCWEPEFSQLVRDVEKHLSIAVECMALDDLGDAITFGLDQRTPQLDQVPSLYPIRLAIDKAQPPHRPEGQAMTSYATYEEGVCRTLWTWANRHHQCKLDEKHDRVPVLADESASENILTPQDVSRAKVIRYAISRKQRHRWFRSLKSSQALAQSVFGALHAFDRLDLLQDVSAECGQSAFFEDSNDWTLCLEHEMNSLGEPRPTNVDVLLSGPEKRVAIECKFTEQEFGTCSRPRLRPGDANYAEQYCNGKYQVQRQRHSRCTLTEAGIRYWEHLPHLFDWPADRDHVPCPFKDVYQLARNALVAALTPDGKPNRTIGHALVVYDARNPEFQVGGEAERQWNQAVAACRMPGLLRRVSWQRLMAAITRAPELEYLVKDVTEKYGIEPD